VPPAKPLSYVLWDGTDPADSQVLGRALARLGWVNQVDGHAPLATVASNQPPVLQPAGVDGLTISEDLLFRGMFEFPQAVLGKPLRGDSSGHSGSIVAVSGHGVPGFMFSESLLPIAMSRPIEATSADWRTSPGRWHYATQPRWTSPDTKVVIFSACRQLQGAPQQFFWSQTMRGSDPVHAILSYRQTAPSAQASAGVNRRLIKYLRAGDTFVKAWQKSHSASSQSYRWAALCHEASVGDTLVDWMHAGRLPSRPDSNGTILYFDADIPNGRPVVEPVPDIDCWLTPRGMSDRLPPWYLCGNGATLDLHIRLLQPGLRLQAEDRIFIIASQVRHDYFGPFRIQDLFTFEGQDSLFNQGVLGTHRMIHQEAPGYGDDTYGLTVRPAVGSPPLDPDACGITIPIKLGRAQNPHIPLYYFHIALRGAGGREAGIRTGHPLSDAFQFGMFLLPWP